MKALLGAFNQEKALVGAFSVIIQPVVEPMDRFTGLIMIYQSLNVPELNNICPAHLAPAAERHAQVGSEGSVEQPRLQPARHARGLPQPQPGQRLRGAGVLLDTALRQLS